MFKLIQLKIQNFGQFLSNMMMPNISIFITWGIINVLFTPLGWQPNQVLEKLSQPIIFYLLPILIGYTAGRLLGGERGGIIGSITTIGIITSTKTPVLLGSMVAGTLGGWIIKYFDNLVKNKIKHGFEMLVNNFSIAIIGIFLSIVSLYFIGPFVEWILNYIGCLLNVIINYNLLPLIAIIIEPAKIFFLNNAINHGIFSNLGLKDILAHQNSIFFLIETNPGPGLGVLLSCVFFGKKEYYKSAWSASIVHFLGGVHEVYFPYVLMNPKLLLSLILGSMTGIFMLVCFQGGLIGIVSPGSIVSILAMTQKDFYYINIFSIFCSFVVSFITSFILLKFIDNKNNKNICQKVINNSLFNYQNSKSNEFFKNIKIVIVACDAGMGSSAIGASILRKKIKIKNLTNISIFNSSIRCIPKNADLVITHKNLTSRAKEYFPDVKHISLVNFLDETFYDYIVNKLIENNDVNYNECINNIVFDNDHNQSNKLFKLSAKNIFLNQFANSKEEAIRIVGQYLVKQGYVKTDYIQAMIEREKISSTWLGEHIALPHGTLQAKDDILKTGIVFCQFPNGVLFGDNFDDIAYLIIGVAARNNEHIMVVSKITNALDNKEIINKLSKTKSIKEVLSYFQV